jgi:hypothetical protein
VTGAVTGVTFQSANFPAAPIAGGADVECGTELGFPNMLVMVAMQQDTPDTIVVFDLAQSCTAGPTPTPGTPTNTPVPPTATATSSGVLYNQYNNAGSNATSSQDFEAANDPFDDELADDFVVPGGETWTITGVDVDGVYFNGTGPAESVNVRFYQNSGTLPGTLVTERLAQSYTGSGGDFVINFGSSVVLTSGTYWMSVQARQDFTPAGQWGWTDRTVQSNNPAAWQNPGGGFGVCPTWQPRGTVCGIDPGVPDQVFSIRGSSGGGGPTPTATPGGGGTCTWVIQPVVPGGPPGDGSFETGTPNSFWEEFSTNFGTPLCDLNCGTGGGTGPHTGDWWAWFGGIDALETGYLRQTVTIPTGSAFLFYWLEIPSVGSNPADYMSVMIDNTPLVTYTIASTGFETYAFVSHNISSFANGASHQVRFESTTYGGGVTNFFVDDVGLRVCPGPTSVEVADFGSESQPDGAVNWALPVALLAALTLGVWLQRRNMRKTEVNS